MRTTWDEKMKIKTEKQELKAREAEVKQMIQNKRDAEIQRRKQKREWKQANEKKSSVYQVVRWLVINLIFAFPG